MFLFTEHLEYDYFMPWNNLDFFKRSDRSTWSVIGQLARAILRVPKGFKPSMLVDVMFLRSTFATHGLPELLVSDNGSEFTSQEFKTFYCSPYHRPSNGLAE